MSEGPFRDTLTPLIADARRQLGDLQRERSALEGQLEVARIRLEEKAARTRLERARLEAGTPLEPIFPMNAADVGVSIPDKRKFWIGMLAGLLSGLTTWLPIFGHGR